MKRAFSSGILNHCYQRTIDDIVIFYNVSDYLVYFTLFCVTAKKYGVRVLALSPMPDHIHYSVITDSLAGLRAFVDEQTSLFSRANNESCHRRGPLFEVPFGSAPKNGAKKARANIIYVGNNGVERQLASKAEEYRWNFLAYAKSTHPFSEPLILRKASWYMNRAVREVRAEYKRGKPMTYPMLQRLFSKLEKRERLQLVDFIITTYNVIDYETAARFFDGYDNMISAMHSNTGSEYDLNEVFIGKSDRCYNKMTKILIRELSLKDIHVIFLLSEQKRTDLFIYLHGKVDANPRQIAKFLRIPFVENGEKVGLSRRGR